MFQKKRKSSEFNPENYEHIKSSPSLKIWSHESVKDTVKFDKWVNLRGAKKYQKKFLRSDGVVLVIQKIQLTQNN